MWCTSRFHFKTTVIYHMPGMCNLGCILTIQVINGQHIENLFTIFNDHQTIVNIALKLNK